MIQPWITWEGATPDLFGQNSGRLETKHKEWCSHPVAVAGSWVSLNYDPRTTQSNDFEKSGDIGKLTRWIGSGLIVTQVCYFKNAGDCKIQLRTHFLNLLMLQSRMTSKIHLHLSALVKKRYIPLWHSSIWSVFFCSKILIDVTYQLFRESHGIGGPEIEMKIIME